MQTVAFGLYIDFTQHPNFFEIGVVKYKPIQQEKKKNETYTAGCT